VAWVNLHITCWRRREEKTGPNMSRQGKHELQVGRRKKAGRGDVRKRTSQDGDLNRGVKERTSISPKNGISGNFYRSKPKEAAASGVAQR